MFIFEHPQALIINVAFELELIPNRTPMKIDIFISDSTRLVYNILHTTEVKNIPGLLMLIDFEKAFDSLSWKFLYKVLKFFEYCDNLIK